MTAAAMPPETAAELARHRTHEQPVAWVDRDGAVVYRCPRCRVEEWDSDSRPAMERVTGYAPNATCPEARPE